MILYTGIHKERDRWEKSLPLIMPFLPANAGAAGEGSVFAPSSSFPLGKQLLPGILFPRPPAEISHFKIITSIGLKTPLNRVGSVPRRVVQLDGAWLGREPQRCPRGDAGASHFPSTSL